MSFHISEPYLPPWGGGRWGLQKTLGDKGLAHGWRGRGDFPVLLVHLSGLGDVLNVTDTHFSSDVSMHTFGERGVESFLMGKMGNKNIPLTELQGLNETT